MMRKKSLFFEGLILALVLSACSYTSVGKPTVEEPVTEVAKILAVGPVEGANQEFYEGLMAGINTVEAVTVLERHHSDELASGALILSGDITVNARNSFGEKAGRHLLGFGAGRQEILGHFELKTTDKKTIMSFDANEYYNGGSGLGGFLDVPGWVVGPFVDAVPFFYQTDLISTDTMQKRLGIEVGEQVRKWLLVQKAP